MLEVAEGCHAFGRSAAGTELDWVRCSGGGIRPEPRPLPARRTPLAIPGGEATVPFDEGVMPRALLSEGVETLDIIRSLRTDAAQRCRSALMATVILMRSPTLRTPISFNADWSTSSSTLPRMSFWMNVSWC